MSGANSSIAELRALLLGYQQIDETLGALAVLGRAGDQKAALTMEGMLVDVIKELQGREPEFTAYLTTGVRVYMEYKAKLVETALAEKEQNRLNPSKN